MSFFLFVQNEMLNFVVNDLNMKHYMKSKIASLFFLFLPLASCAQEKQCCVECAPLYGKTINVIGDSYVRNHRRPVNEAWHYKVAEKYGMKYNNYGRNGCCIAFDRTKDGFGKPLWERYREMTDSADYVLVIAGHNDAGMVGNSADSLKVFKTRMSELCERLIEKYPSAKLAFVTPWNVGRPGFDKVIEAMKQICAHYSIPIFDASAKSGIYVRNENFRKKYFQAPSDTAHLNSEGHDLFMNKGESFLLSL